ncbi:MAG: hypothetical protein AAF092_11960 [Pseudomonadota bacterium]
MTPLADLLLPALAALALLAGGTLVGYGASKKLITMGEARHGLKQGSASQLRALAGWFWVLLWLAVLWFGGTIIGNWGATGDLEGAINRSELRLWLLIELIGAAAD